MTIYGEKIAHRERVNEQYKDGKNLSQRFSIHQKYSVNKEGLGSWLFKQYDFFKGCKVLELGCGTGDMWRGKIEDLPECMEVFLTDFTEGMVNELSVKFSAYANIKTQMVDIQDIPFESEHFDIVIANLMLYHVPDIDKALKEVYRVLKPNGKFYVATVGDNHMMEINKWVKEFDSSLDVFNSTLISFKLQNGKDILQRLFRSINSFEYFDHLEISNKNDLLDYICSLKNMVDMSDTVIKGLSEFLETKRDNKGLFKISKQVGTFIAMKG